MAKKQRERSEAEALRSENRTLKKEINNLKKELGRHEKREHQYLDLEEREKQEGKAWDDFRDICAKNMPLCPKCSKQLKITDLGSRKLFNCECGYRKSGK